MYTTSLSPEHAETIGDAIARPLGYGAYAIDIDEAEAALWTITRDDDGRPTALVLRDATYTLRALTADGRPVPHIGDSASAVQEPEPPTPLGWAWTSEQHTDPAELRRRVDAYAEHARWAYGRIAYLESRIRDLGALPD